MTITQLKKVQEETTSQAIKETGMFFAFSNDQFEKSKTTLEEEDKYVSFGMGCYIPKSKIELWKALSKEIDNNFISSVKEHDLVEKHIIYELQNYESFYTMDTSDASAILKAYYTEEEINKVFWKCVESGYCD